MFIIRPSVAFTSSFVWMPRSPSLHVLHAPQNPIGGGNHLLLNYTQILGLLGLHFREIRILGSGMARVRLADLNGPKWTSSGQNGLSILVARMQKSGSE